MSSNFSELHDTSEKTCHEKMLHYFGFGPEPIIESIKAGYAKYRSYRAACYPKTAAGQMAYIETTGMLRTVLPAEYGYITESVNNHERAVSSDKTIAIVVNHADFTGEGVRTKGKKGMMSLAAIKENAKQLSLFPGFTSSGAPAIESGQILWFLLHDFDESTGIIQMRLAVPIGTVNGKPSTWDPERVIDFDPIHIDEVSVTSAQEQVFDEAAIVYVERKENIPS